MTQTFKVLVDRYNPETKEASVQTYEVEFIPSQTVLQTLNIIRDTLDDSLSFRSSCQGAKCGSCAVALNGKPVLACNTMIDGRDITIGPLPNFPVINDLIVDRSQCEDYFLKCWPGQAPAKAPVTVTLTKSRKRFYPNQRLTTKTCRAVSVAWSVPRPVRTTLKWKKTVPTHRCWSVC